jgi:alpha-methylacyl-CoA racemase
VTGPLQGFRVVEMGGIGPAPFAGGLLGDLGADVVRIDRIAKPGAEPETPLRFDFYNRNKRSVALDLKKPEAVATVLKLLEKADALIEGFRPGVMERLGLGPEVCRKANPRLVYARMTGWGQTGPIAQEAGHDINYLALTGALHSIGDADRPPPPPLNLVADLGGGALYLAVGVLAATLEARSSGQGQTVDVAMIDGVTHLMSAFQAFRQQGVWTDKRADNIVDGGAPFYRSYATKDGKYVVVGAIEPQFYANLLSVMGLEPSNLPDQNDRRAWPRMRDRFASVFRTRTRDEWIALAAGRDACLAPVLSIDEAPEHPQMQARKVYSAFDGLRHPSPAPRFDRTPATLDRATPRPGQNSREALADWGLAPEEIAALDAGGAMVQT